MNPVLGVVILPTVIAIYTILVLLLLDTSEIYVQYLVIIPLSYVLGAIPWGFLLSRISKGIDVRQYGSGKTGMSNVLRTAGGRIATLVFIFDITKGALVVLLARAITDSPLAEVVAALLSLVGHNWSVFLGFTGGRGLLTGFGSLLVMSPISGLIAISSFLPITLITRYLSLGSIIGTIVACLTLLILTIPGMPIPISDPDPIYIAYTFIAAVIILWQHRDNIRRLLRGQEQRLGQPAERLNK